MNRNLLKNKTALATVIIALVAIVVVVGIAGGAYYIMTQNNSPSPSPSESPTPSASPTGTINPSASTSPTVVPSPTETVQSSPSTSPSNAPNVAGASSLQYSVSLTEAGVFQGSYTFSGKNAGTTNFMMRIDYTPSSGNQTGYIINGAEQKAWAYLDGQWEDLSTVYTMQYNTWSPMWQGYVNSLSAWTGSGDYSYTQGNSTVRIYDISVNPVLADSLFQHA
jgi:hypothetical protein